MTRAPSSSRPGGEELGHTLQNKYRNTSEHKRHTRRNLRKHARCKNDTDKKTTSGQLALAV